MPGTPHRLRTDLSATLFLGDPADYDGGELVVEDTYGAHAVKLPAGHMVLYPASSLHRVNPVTRGARLAAFFWIQSMVRDDGRRTLLYDLDTAIQHVAAGLPDHPGGGAVDRRLSQPAARLGGHLMAALSLLRRLHRWLGLLLAVPLLVQGLTGAILALAPVLPNLAAVATAKGEPAGAGAIIAAAQASMPARPARGALPSSRGARRDGAGAFRRPSRVARPGPRRAPSIRSRLPCSIAPAGDGLIDWIKALHTNLLIEGRSGRSIIGWIGVGLLALAMIGVVLWWPPSGHGGAGRSPRICGRGVMCSTGDCMAWPASGASRCCWRPRPPAWCWRFRRRCAVRSAWRLPIRGGPPSGPRRRRWTWTARSAWPRGAAPGLRVRAVLLPASGADPVRILLVPPDAEGAVATVAVAVDAAASRVLSVQDPRTMTVAELVLRWAHDLHFGQALRPAVARA